MREPVPFGRYLLLERVDVGGMAEVFTARVTEGEGAGRLVAVKRLLPTLAEDPACVAMFLDEARIAVQLDHPSIARVDDLGQHGTTYYIAMEYVAGRPLKAVMEALAARGERLAVPLCALVVVRVLEALEHAHARCDGAGRPLGIVHRDVSPQNVLLSFEGEVKLIDFGLAHAGRTRRAPGAGGRAREDRLPEPGAGARAAGGPPLRRLLGRRRPPRAPHRAAPLRRAIRPARAGARPRGAGALAAGSLAPGESRRRSPVRCCRPWNVIRIARPPSAAALARVLASHAIPAGPTDLARLLGGLGGWSG